MTNERDDEILGRALSRAIETLDPAETPYGHSRIGAPRARQGTSFWRLSALAASIVIAGALGSQLLTRPAADEPVGVQPSATIAPGATQAATSSPAATPTAAPTAIDHDRIFFARDGLPPVSVHTDKARSDGPTDKRVALRLALALIEDPGAPLPSGAIDARPPRGAVTRVAGVVISGGVATVDLTVPNGWKVSGSAATTALLQQIVYTATEEPGVDRLLVTENGGKPTTIDQFVWDKPLAREDVSGYSSVKYDTTSRGEEVSDVQSRPCAPNCPSPVPARLSNNYSVDTFAMGVARFVVQVDSGDWQEFNASGGMTVDVKNPAWSKYMIRLEVHGTEIKPGLEIVDRSPLRSIRSVTGGGTTFYELALDDHRPWRVAFLTNPDRIVIDVGGYARALSDTTAVYSPRPGDISRQFTVTGLSRTFEGTTQWRVVDSARRVVTSGFTTASRGTSAVWGTYQVSVQLPATVSGNVTLEVYWGSPRDGSEVGLVQVPLTVR
jgi:hypothetical protein